MYQIPLSQGVYAVVDDESVRKYPELSGRCWHVVRNSVGVRYARTYYRGEDGRLWYLYMHRLVCAAGTDVKIRHRDGDGLNNRLSNLVVMDRPQRGVVRVRMSSRYWGVSRHKSGRGWISRISIGGKCMYLGYYRTEAEAAGAYNDACKLYQMPERKNVIRGGV